MVARRITASCSTATSLFFDLVAHAAFQGFGIEGYAFAAIELIEPPAHVSAELLKPGAVEVIAFFEEPESIADDLACRVIEPAFDLFVDELFELAGEGNVHEISILDDVSNCQLWLCVAALSERTSHPPIIIPSDEIPRSCPEGEACKRCEIPLVRKLTRKTVGTLRVRRIDPRCVKPGHSFQAQAAVE